MNYLIFILVLVNILIYQIIFTFLTSRELVHFLNIGQGNAVLIKDKKNAFLYDTGKNNFLLLKNLDKTIPFYQKKIDLLFLSHADKDHYGSLPEIIKRYKVRMIILSSLDFKDENFNQTIETIKKKKIPLLVLKRGDKISTNKFRFFVLHPEKKYSKDNNNSLVLKVIGRKTYLLTGDIEKEAIESLISFHLKNKLKYFQNLKSDFLLVPHHGSRFSLNKAFYYWVRPGLAIIQVGKNFYNHPHQEVIDFLYREKINFWKTDQKGDLIIYD